MGRMIGEKTKNVRPYEVVFYSFCDKETNKICIFICLAIRPKAESQSVFGIKLIKEDAYECFVRRQVVKFRNYVVILLIFV